jgi:hypothetical protein
LKKQLLVSIADSHMDRMSKVVEALENEGLEVQRAMPAVGVVSGAAEQEAVPSLRAVSGVTAVEEQRSVEPLSPDSPIQ